MNTQRFQQLRTSIRHTFDRHSLALGLGLLLLVAALAAQRYGVPAANQAWPGPALVGDVIVAPASALSNARERFWEFKMRQVEQLDGPIVPAPVQNKSRERFWEFKMRQVEQLEQRR
jgi:hypothetical protein